MISYATQPFSTQENYAACFVIVCTAECISSRWMCIFCFKKKSCFQSLCGLYGPFWWYSSKLLTSFHKDSLECWEPLPTKFWRILLSVHPRLLWVSLLWKKRKKKKDSLQLRLNLTSRQIFCRICGTRATGTSLGAPGASFADT